MPASLAIICSETRLSFLLKLAIAVSGFVSKLNQRESVLYDGDICSFIFSLSSCAVVALDSQLVLTFHIFPSLVSRLLHVLSCQGHFWQFFKTTSARCSFITIILLSVWPQ